jgi:hypothetical protein
LDQSVHGNDFWQTDFDPVRKRWQITYNIPPNACGETVLEFRRTRK